MIILVTYQVPEADAATVSGGNVVYRPDLADASPAALADALAETSPDALVTASPVPAGVLAAWRAPLVVVQIGADTIADALARAEREWQDAICAVPTDAAGPANVAVARKSVLLVGAGAVNLTTALRLVRSGYQVDVYDQAPDPRADAHWTDYGCTRGGGDGRMFTLTEADSYNNRSQPGTDGSAGLLARAVSDDGWLIAKPGSLAPVELRWADDFHRIPSWLADSYNADIFDVNRLAGQRWAELMESLPDLFGEDTGYRDGILRLYTESDYFRWHVARNDSVGAVRRVLAPEQIRADYPAFNAACDSGTVVGGIEVTGFTVNIHRFVARLVDLLERDGVRFHWHTRVTGIHWSAPELADGLETADGDILRADHYVLSPGAYGADLLRGTASHERIQGMLGVWFTVPNIEPRLDHSVKITRVGHRAEETNVTLATDALGKPVLVCGAGYGWTGLQPTNVDSAELDALYDGLEDTLRRIFPRALAAARADGSLAQSRRLCVRPWTASCLGVFERIPAVGGGSLVVTGGHNTGGFAQAPVVADAVLAALRGNAHAMHSRYHPARLARFYVSGSGSL